LPWLPVEVLSVSAAGASKTQQEANMALKVSAPDGVKVSWSSAQLAAVTAAQQQQQQQQQQQSSCSFLYLFYVL
jgi:hypothetical protein